MAAKDIAEERDAGLDAPVVMMLLVPLVLVGIWLLFGFSAMFWPALILTPVIFAVLLRISTGRV